jgi:hypothetical protein
MLKRSGRRITLVASLAFICFIVKGQQPEPAESDFSSIMMHGNSLYHSGSICLFSDYSYPKNSRNVPVEGRSNSRKFEFEVFPNY